MNTTTEKRYHLTLLLVRVTLGIVIAGHGFQKLLGWFGGFGFDGTMLFFTDTIGLPYIFGVAIILAESLGMIALIAGVFGRFFAGSMIIIILGALFTTHLPYGFFMDWFGVKKGEGYEFDLLVIGLALVTVVNGSGAYSLDRYIFHRLKPGARSSSHPSPDRSLTTP